MSETPIIKSKDRVKRLGEVNTPPKLVCSMLDLQPSTFADSTKYILEPACGDGNFLVEILDRRLKLCRYPRDVLQAVSTIYGIDIDAQNIKDAYKRLYWMCRDNVPESTICFDKSLEALLNMNLIVGNTLEDANSIVFVKWAIHDEHVVPLSHHTLGSMYKESKPAGRNVKKKRNINV